MLNAGCCIPLLVGHLNFRRIIALLVSRGSEEVVAPPCVRSTKEAARGSSPGE